jgi:hypothetical protein
VVVAGELVRHHDAEYQEALDTWRGLTEEDREIMLETIGNGAWDNGVPWIAARLLKAAAR